MSSESPTLQVQHGYILFGVQVAWRAKLGRDGVGFGTHDLTSVCQACYHIGHVSPELFWLKWDPWKRGQKRGFHRDLDWSTWLNNLFRLAPGFGTGAPVVPTESHSQK